MAKRSAPKQFVDWDGLLSKHPLFISVGGKERTLLLSDKVSRKHEFAADEVVLRQGETGNSLFIVCEGKVSVTLTAQNGEEIDLYTLTDGEVFGEMALFGQRPRAATLVATEPSKLLEIPGDKILSLMKTHHEIANYLLARLSQRLRHTDDMILTRRISGIDTSVNDIKTQLDVMVQTTDAKLTAAQAMFDQTNTRAGEIIESAGRARTRMAFLATTATTLLALVAGAGFINFQSAREEISRTQEKIERVKVKVEESAKQVEGLASTVGDNAKDAAKDAGDAASASSSATQAASDIDKTGKQIERLQKEIDETSRKASVAYYDLILSTFKNDLTSGNIRTPTAAYFVELVSNAPADYGAAVTNHFYQMIMIDDAKERNISYEKMKAIFDLVEKNPSFLTDDALVYIEYYTILINILSNDRFKGRQPTDRMVRLKNVIKRSETNYEKILIDGQNDPSQLERRFLKLGAMPRFEPSLLHELFGSLRGTL